jgi:hypothetical protein
VLANAGVSVVFGIGLGGWTAEAVHSLRAQRGSSFAVVEGIAFSSATNLVGFVFSTPQGDPVVTAAN